MLVGLDYFVGSSRESKGFVEPDFAVSCAREARVGVGGDTEESRLLGAEQGVGAEN